MAILDPAGSTQYDELTKRLAALQVASKRGLPAVLEAPPASDGTQRFARGVQPATGRTTCGRRAGGLIPRRATAIRSRLVELGEPGLSASPWRSAEVSVQTADARGFDDALRRLKYPPDNYRWNIYDGCSAGRCLSSWTFPGDDSISEYLCCRQARPRAGGHDEQGEANDSCGGPRSSRVGRRPLACMEQEMAVWARRNRALDAGVRRIRDRSARKENQFGEK